MLLVCCHLQHIWLKRKVKVETSELIIIATRELEVGYACSRKPCVLHCKAFHNLSKVSQSVVENLGIETVTNRLGK